MTFQDARDPRPTRSPDGDPAWITEDVDVVRASLARTTAADPTRVARLRQDFAAWLAVDLPAGDLFDDIVLAVYEALANVAEHAYAGGPAGTVHLVAHRSADFLRVTVTDHGHWRARREEPFRNRGLTFVHLLMTQVHIATDETGTSVHLNHRLPPPTDGPAPLRR